MNALNFFAQAFSAIFLAINPIAVLALYIAMTPEYTPRHRIQVAKTGCWTAFSIMLCFALTGRLFFDYLGLSTEAFQIAGGIFLCVIGFVMLRGQSPKESLSEEERAEIVQKKDIAITPLAVPMIAGPACISTTMLMQTEAMGSLWMQLVLVFAIFCVAAAMYGLFYVVSKGSKWLTTAVFRLSYRLSGLVIMAIAVQFIITGLKDIGKQQTAARAKQQAAVVTSA